MHERFDARARLRVPDMYPLVAAGAGDPLAVRRNRRRAYRISMPFDFFDWRARPRVPDAHNAVGAPADNPPAVRRISDRMGIAPIPDERFDARARLRVPYLNGAVAASADDMFSVRRIRRRIDDPYIPFDRVEKGARLRAPYLKADPPPGGDALAVRRERGEQEAALMRVYCGNKGAEPDIPDADGVVVRDGCDAMPVRRERKRLRPALIAERRKRRSRRGCPQLQPA